MASDTNIKVCVRGMNAGIKDFMVTMLIILVPFPAALNFAFITYF